jgi:hypothetical protein
MNKNTIFKEAVVLLIAAMFMFTSMAVMADTQEQPTMDYENEQGISKIASTPATTGDVVWDNGMTYSMLGAAQMEPSYGELGTMADDFQFDTNQDVNDVHWVGGYWNTNYQQGAFDWNITFHEDGGNIPGAIYAGPFIFAWDAIAQTFLEDTGTAIYYELSVDLPETVSFAADTLYWIAVRGEGVFPPQSGAGLNNDTILLNEAHWRSEFFGYPDWTSSTIPWYEELALAFQLTLGVPAIPDLECDGQLAWEEVVPGETVEGTFEVSNAGDPESLLNWEISGVPDFGTNWTFDPDGGSGLTPEDGAVTVSVSVEAPPDEETEFTGEITIVNSADPADECTISVSLITPYSQPTLLQQLLQLLFARFPILALIFG